MPKQVPIDHVRLRAAVADERYWRTSHPEREAWRAWVGEGYRALYADSTVPQGGIVHVRAYTRDGNTVSAHTRSATSRGRTGSDGSSSAAFRADVAEPITRGLDGLTIRRRSLLEGSAVIPVASSRRPDEILGRRSETIVEGGGGGGGAHRSSIGRGQSETRPAPAISPRSQELVDVIAPGGRPSGVQQGGARSSIRTLPGGEPAAEAMLQRLINGRGAVDITPPRYSGRMYRLDDGTVIGFRPSSASGSPAIDINIPGYATVRKLHF